MIALLLMSVVQVQLPPIHRCPNVPPPPPVYGEYTICVPATGKDESYHVDGPPLVPGQSYPLVVMFHGSYADHDQILIGGASAFAQAAKTAGYMVMMHDGGWHQSPPPSSIWHNSTYGSEPFQRHTEAAIKSVLTSFGSYVDRERIYGYGFSMGGGNVLTFAARHLDPTAAHGMFAAIVDQSSLTSAPLWWASDPQGTTFLEDLYGSSYSVNPFVYRRASVIDSSCVVGSAGCLVPQCGPVTVLADGSMATNLFHLPVHTFYDDCEDNEILIESCNLLDGFLQGSPNYATAGTSGPHAWSSVSPATVLDFFDPPTAPPKTLSAATLAALSGDLFFAEDNRRAFHFQVKRLSTNDLGRMHWEFPVATPNAVVIEMATHFAVPNVDYVTVFLDEYSPLDPTGCLFVYHHDNVQIHVKGYTTQPAQVFKGPSPALSGTWNWNASTQTLVLNYNTAAQTTTWRVAPTVGDCP